MAGEDQSTVTDTSKPAKLVSVGKAQPVKVGELAHQTRIQNSAGNEGGSDQGGGAASGSGAAGVGAGAGGDAGAGASGNSDASRGTSDQNSGNQSNSAITDPLEGLTDEQVTSLLKSRGIYDGDLNSLRDKLKPPPVELTEEQKIQRAKDHDKRRLDLWVKNGGTPEDYVAMKNAISADVASLSEQELRRELEQSEQKFSKEEIDNIIAERYYQIPDEEIEKLANESEKDFLKRKKAYGAKKLASRSGHIPEKAKEFLKQLDDALARQDAELADETGFTQKVEDHVASMPKKLTFELGEANGQKLPQVEINVDESVLAEVKDVLKDPAKRNQFFYNPDSSLNVSNVADLMVRNKILEAALRETYLKGQSDEVEKVKKVFPNGNPHDIGVGGAPRNNNGQAGKLVSVGKPVPVAKTS